MRTIKLNNAIEDEGNDSNATNAAQYLKKRAKQDFYPKSFPLEALFKLVGFLFIAFIFLWGARDIYFRLLGINKQVELEHSIDTAPSYTIRPNKKDSICSDILNEYGEVTGKRCGGQEDFN